MKHRILILTIGLMFTASLDARAQSPAEQRASTLSQQLAETRAKKESLEARLKQLEEEIKPENIEKSLAGVGSTRPEDVRDQRRRQLDLEKTNIKTQLKLLVESQTRVEAGIRQADADAYHQSAMVNAVGTRQVSAQPQPARASSAQRRPRRTKNRPKRPRVYRLIN